MSNDNREYIAVMVECETINGSRYTVSFGQDEVRVIGRTSDGRLLRIVDATVRQLGLGGGLIASGHDEARDYAPCSVHTSEVVSITATGAC